MKFFRNMNKGQKGFTLIELLVVVAILGILAAVAIPNIAKFIGEGESEAAVTELANVQTAVIAGMYDSEITELTVASDTFGPGDDVALGASGNVLSEYVLGGQVEGAYIVYQDGHVEQTAYPAP